MSINDRHIRRSRRAALLLASLTLLGGGGAPLASPAAALAQAPGNPGAPTTPAPPGASPLPPLVLSLSKPSLVGNAVVVTHFGCPSVVKLCEGGVTAFVVNDPSSIRPGVKPSGRQIGFSQIKLRGGKRVAISFRLTKSVARYMLRTGKLDIGVYAIVRDRSSGRTGAQLSSSIVHLTGQDRRLTHIVRLKVSITSLQLVAGNTAVRARIRCSANERECLGELVAFTPRKGKSKLRLLRSGALVGSSGVAVRGGQSTTVTLHLRQQLLRALRRVPSVVVDVLVVARDPVTRRANIASEERRIRIPGHG